MNPVNIGSRLELFVDECLIERLAGEVVLHQHQPVPRELVSPIEEAGDHLSLGYMSVFQDGGRYRMYYYIVQAVEGRTCGGQRICYAESKDGIHWEKPTLNLVAYNGSTENNVILLGDGVTRREIHRFAPFIDGNPNCPAEAKYKALVAAAPLGQRGPKGEGLLAMSSPDGLHWCYMQANPIMTGGPGWGQFDSHNVAFWDSVRGEYRLYRREVFTEGPLRCFRDILTATSPDFLHWTQPQRLHYPGAVPEQMYTNNVAPYFRAPHLFVGFPVRYIERRWSEAIANLPERSRREAVIRAHGEEPVEPTNEGGGQRAGTALTDCLFMSSRDGVNFRRWGEAFIRPGLRAHDNWFYGDNYPNWGIVATASGMDDSLDELSFYVSEGYWRPGRTNSHRRYTLRLDGFVSVRASRQGGELRTHPVVFDGNELVINFSTSAAGSLRVGLCDENGWPIPGYRLEDCIEQIGDAIDRRVAWKQGGDLTALIGKPVKVCFFLCDADLFSFQFRHGNAPLTDKVVT